MLRRFERFRLDRANQRLEDAAGPIRLKPKAFDVLSVLVERPGQLVSKSQLLDEVWPGTHVSEGMLTLCIAEIRSALGDSATHPRFIETVHRRGYRFLAAVTATRPAEPRPAPIRAWPPGDPAAHRPSVGLVGRGPELDLLARSLARALAGERQVVFVTGEPGAGKTALVEHFVAAAGAREALAITGGQCLERFGSAEAYMPVLEAIGRLVREEGAARRLLRRFAPTWLAQLPWLLEEERSARLEQELMSAARHRMLREMTEFVEALGAEIPLVLVLEDLHWSDPSTVDLLSLLASRREPARLLVIGSYRPVDLILGGHPLRTVAHALTAKRRCEEIAIDALGAEAVAEYLEKRFPGSRLPAETAAMLRARTDGNPLFLETLVDLLIARGAIVERDQRWQATAGFREALTVVPDTVRLLLEQQLQRLTADERELLEAASLVGTEFSATAAAAAAGATTADAEERCARLVGAGPFVSRAGAAAWPDGTVSERFAFRHALYRETLAAAVLRGRRSAMHLRIGRTLEEAWGGRAAELAAELALHFEEGGDRERAIRYRRSAAETAARRFAQVEAEHHLECALASLVMLPATPERDHEELSLQSMIATARQATRGYAAPEVTKAFRRALELSGGAARGPSAFAALFGLWTFCTVTGDLARALDLARQNLTIAEAAGDRLMRLMAHQGLWTTHFFRGEYAATLDHLDRGEPLYDRAADRGAALVYGTDPMTAALAYRSLALWAIGAVDQAAEVARRGVENARALGHPLSLGRALVFAAWLRHCRREPDPCEAEAETLFAYCGEWQLPFWMPHALGLRGWVLAERGETERGIAEMEEGLALWDAIGASCGRSPHDLTLAAAYVRVGRLNDARAALGRARAVVAAGERFHEPEMHRVEAELVLAEAGGLEAARIAVRERAEALVTAGIACAARQGARTLELRATTMLARLFRSGVKGRQVRGRLAELVASFSEGLDTADLQDARRLLVR